MDYSSLAFQFFVKFDRFFHKFIKFTKNVEFNKEISIQSVENTLIPYQKIFL